MKWKEKHLSDVNSLKYWKLIRTFQLTWKLKCLTKSSIADKFLLTNLFSQISLSKLTKQKNSNSTAPKLQLSFIQPIKVQPLKLVTKNFLCLILIHYSKKNLDSRPCLSGIINFLMKNLEIKLNLEYWLENHFLVRLLLLIFWEILRDIQLLIWNKLLKLLRLLLVVKRNHLKVKFQLLMLKKLFVRK